MLKPMLHAILVSVAVGCATDPAGRVVRPAAPVEVVRESGRGARPLPVVSREGAGDVVVARIGDAEIRRSDVGDFVIRYFRDQANEAVTHLVDEAVLLAVARAEGILLPEGLLDREVDGELEDRERRVRVQFGADVGLEEYLLERYGVGLAQHRRDLERLVRARLLRDRVIRLRQARTDRVEVRDAVFADLATAEDASRSAARGADLSALAAARGVRKSTALPPFPRDGMTPAELAEQVWSLAPGEVSGPIAVEEEGRKLFHVFKMVRRLPGRDVGWSDVRQEVEQGLAERPLESWEYAQWARQVREELGLTIVR